MEIFGRTHTSLTFLYTFVVFKVGQGQKKGLQDQNDCHWGPQ
jgi:hypothetical protein